MKNDERGLYSLRRSVDVLFDPQEGLQVLFVFFRLCSAQREEAPPAATPV